MRKSSAKSGIVIANLVGVDAGGTKTSAVFADGTIVRKAQGPAANPTLIGIDDAADAILRTVREAAHGDAIDAMYVGAAGAGSRSVAGELESLLSAAYPHAKVRVGDDVEIVLRAAIASGAGIALVAGTGSIALASDTQGALHRVGGFGYLLGDEGSAAWIGLEAVRLLARVYDGRAREEETSRLVARHLCAPDRPSLIREMYGERIDVARIAALAPSIIAFAGKGNRASNEIVLRAAGDLARLVVAAARLAQLLESAPPVVFSGGLVQEEHHLGALLEAAITSEIPGAQIIRGGDPLDGAIRCAQALL